MAKTVKPKPDWLKNNLVLDICSVSSCTSSDFHDYQLTPDHNGYGLYNDPETILRVAKENEIDLSDCTLFYYEGYDLQCYEDDPTWEAYEPNEKLETRIIPPKEKELLGYDIISYAMGQYPECSYLSCNHMAEEIQVNEHCLLDDLKSAINSLNEKRFEGCEPGPCRIYAVYKTNLPNQALQATSASARRLS